jgi:hypothetical protein
MSQSRLGERVGSIAVSTVFALHDGQRTQHARHHAPRLVALGGGAICRMEAAISAVRDGT